MGWTSRSGWGAGGAERSADDRTTSETRRRTFATFIGGVRHTANSGPSPPRRTLGRLIEREGSHMPEAVIVATARSPIGRAGKGSLTSIRADDLAAHMLSAVMEKGPALPAEHVEDVIMGCGH